MNICPLHVRRKIGEVLGLSLTFVVSFGSRKQHSKERGLDATLKHVRGKSGEYNQPVLFVLIIFDHWLDG